MYDFCLLLWWRPKAPSNGLEPTPRPKYGKTLVDHEISLVGGAPHQQSPHQKKPWNSEYWAVWRAGKRDETLLEEQCEQQTDSPPENSTDILYDRVCLCERVAVALRSPPNARV